MIQRKKKTKEELEYWDEINNEQQIVAPAANIKSFIFEGVQVKIRFENGEPYWKAKNVVELLGNTWTGVAIQHVPDQFKLMLLDNTTYGNKNVWYLNEQGLYFYLNRSNSKKALPFQIKVTKILKEIRITGSYSTQTPKTFAEALRLAADQQEQLEKQQPLVTFAENCMKSENTLTMQETSDILNLGRTTFFKILRKMKIIQQGKTIPYSRYIDAGYFEVKNNPIVKENFVIQRAQTFVTARGLVWLSNKNLSK